MRLFNHREMLANTSDPTHLSIDTALAAIVASRETEQPDKRPVDVMAVLS